MRTDGGDDFDAAFAALYPRARGVALRLLGSVPDAEDAAAEAFARALVDWRRVGALPHRDAWILRVTANVAIDAARRRRALPPTADALDAADDLTVLRITLVSALRALPRRQREALVLHHMAGLAERDVADALGVSHNTVKKHLQRGMARLRTSFASEEGMAHVIG
jgi:RNA polymerase sigma-70 factor (ECF subfamily)